MSSRSLAAARARRSGENAPPVSGNRPGTSINSQAAFSQQMPINARISQQMNPSNQQYSQPPPPPVQSSQNKLPFSKLSISDAIGLITLRLGRVEQWVIETEHEKEEQGSESNINMNNLPPNSKIIDNSIFTTIIGRLDSLEKNNSQPIDLETITSEVNTLKEQIKKMGDVSNNHNLLVSKHTEQLFKVERELVETKDILKTFMLKYDNFAKETFEKFTDFEYAIDEIEKNIQNVSDEEINETDEKEETDESDNQETEESEEDKKIPILSSNMKEILKQELSEIN
jgi:hypothetical protein